MNPPPSAWRRLDRYLLRNHPEAWFLELHGLHAYMLTATAVLTLVVWLLPVEELLGYFALVRFLLLLLAVAGANVFAILNESTTPIPLTKGRWPPRLSRWYCQIVLLAPLLFVSLIAQARFQPLTHGHDVNASSLVSKACDKNRWDTSIPLKEECVEAVSRFSGRSRDQIDQGAVVHAHKLSTVVPDELTPRWSDLLLVLLCVLYAAQFFELPMDDVAPQKNSVTLLVLLMGLYCLFIWFAYLFAVFEPPSQPSAWRIVTGIAVLLLFALLYVITSSDRRRGPALTWSWAAVLTGFPLLVLLIPLLLSSPEKRLLHQAILLGGFLLLTPWLHREHERVRALPL